MPETFFDFNKSLQVQEYSLDKGEPLGSSRPATAFELQLKTELEEAEKTIERLLLQLDEYI